MSENNRTYRFGDESIQAPSDLSVDDVRTAWQEVYPALENARALTLDDGSTEFVVQAGTKG